MIETISKNLFLNAVLCATLGWRLRADESLDEAAFASPTLAEQFRMEQGAEIGRRARKPESTEGGRLVSILKWPEGAPLNLG